MENNTGEYIKKLQKNWDELGKRDPFWSVVSHPDKKNGRWEIKEFFDIGVKEIQGIFNYLSSKLNIQPGKERALDFGCGVGRITQALTAYFDEVCGVDISSSMIELAKKHNLHGERCKYYLNVNDNLKIFPNDNFDFIYSNITLQHMKPEYVMNYLKEFIRLLRPDGLLVFQMASERVKTFKSVISRFIPKLLLNFYRVSKHKQGSLIEMHGIKRDEMISFLEENKAKIIDIKQSPSSGKEWISYQYFVKK